MMKLLKNKKFLELGIGVFGVALALIAVITFYGNNVGNFVMSIDPDLKDKEIYISKSSEFINPTSLLQADSVRNARDITYTMVDVEEVKKTDGSYNDPYFKYLAYTFYVKNFGNESTDLSYYLQITSAKKNVDKTIRVMVISEVDGVSTERIYMAKDESEAEYEDIPDCLEFVNEKMIMEDKVYGFFPEQMIKFSVIIWIEGQDPDTTSDILGGQIKIQMKFSAIDSGDEIWEMK